MTDSITLGGLFLSALLSSTLLPGSSEAVLLLLDQNSTHTDFTLLWVATVGNTIGGISTWGIGWLVAKKWNSDRLKQKVNPKSLHWIKQHGAPVLLLSWLPVIGDGLCLAAGWFRLPFISVAIFIGIGKAARYAILLWLL